MAKKFSENSPFFSLPLRKKVSFLLDVFNDEVKGLRLKLIYQNLRLSIPYNMEQELLKKLLPVKSYDGFFEAYILAIFKQKIPAWLKTVNYSVFS